MPVKSEITVKLKCICVALNRPIGNEKGHSKNSSEHFCSDANQKVEDGRMLGFFFGPRWFETLQNTRLESGIAAVQVKQQELL